MTEWKRIKSERIGSFDVVYETTYETMHPSECFDDVAYDIDEIVRKIDSGIDEWFILRASVYLNGICLAKESIGGLLYSDTSEVFTDGTAADLLFLASAKVDKWLDDTGLSNSKVTW